MSASDTHPDFELTPRQKRLYESYKSLSVEELLKAQRVHIKDYYELRDKGMEDSADRILSLINDFGAVIDLRDGTIRS